MSEPPVLAALVSGLRGGSIEVVDLTPPLSSSTPVLRLPPDSDAGRAHSFSTRRSRATRT
ncbi:hypothetical protein ACH4Y0_26045 [Streptomyces sp. NPDC020707]|uniref:hypothetical protein n=1 Tax=Streptomyces sp. NPDC020707 TaxID=3365084 RepID=UPI0037B21551